MTKTALVDNDSDQIEEIISSQDEVVAQSTDLEKPNQTDMRIQLVAFWPPLPKKLPEKEILIFPK